MNLDTILLNVTFSGNCKLHHCKRLHDTLRNLGIDIGACEDWRMLQIHKSAYDRVILKALNVTRAQIGFDCNIIVDDSKLVESSITQLRGLY